MKNIEPVAYQLVAYDAEDIQGGGCIDYAIDEITREPFTDSDMNKHGLTQWDFYECIPLYTEEQLQEYAKELVYEALYKHTDFGTGKENLVRHMTDIFFKEKALLEVQNEEV